ncbi:hypothetical protein [Deinococcus sedimenti]|uniref:Type 4 fimbrial biogenesis protein PilX N-terminal domain-containing protein n=1 Tax=Deinococcus sedimenti TaxID=1867090 RepID=A0ABQ2S6U7_9DEIO|nr:hypothetical protein [Deinococcus sedimenti]GGR91774.1 hypothetical protein GCM10008960_18410 [Deinococcus sedimenti]
MYTNRERGTALITVLMTAVLLMGVVTVTTQLALGSRKTGADDTRTFQSALQGESALADFLVWAQDNGQFLGSVPESCVDSNATQQLACTTRQWLATYPGYGGVTLKLAGIQLDGSNIVTMDVEASSVSGGSNTRIIQQYKSKKLDLKKLNIPSAVLSYPGVDVGGNASIGGAVLNLPLTDSDGLYTDFARAKTTAVTSLSRGTSVQVSVGGTSDQLRHMSRVSVGDYVRLPLADSAAGAVSSGKFGTFKVTAIAGTALTLEAVNVPSVSGSFSPYTASTQQPMDYVMNGVVSNTSNSLTLRTSETFVTGDQVAVKVGNVTYTATVSADGSSTALGTSVSVTGWLPSVPTIPEGTSIVKSTNAVVTGGDFNDCTATELISNNKCIRDVGGGLVGGLLTGTSGSSYALNPADDALFIKTFGMTPAELRTMAKVIPEANFNREAANLNGLTWLTNTGGSVNLNSQKLSGNGILIVDGDLTINQNQADECDMKGVIYVRGNLNIQGNLGLCGAIVVEGSVLDSTGMKVTGSDINNDTDFSGTGRKVQYDPEVLFDITAGSGKYSLSLEQGTWRQR